MEKLSTWSEHVLTTLWITYSRRLPSRRSCQSSFCRPFTLLLLKICILTSYHIMSLQMVSQPVVLSNRDQNCIWRSKIGKSAIQLYFPYAKPCKQGHEEEEECQGEGGRFYAYCYSRQSDDQPFQSDHEVSRSQRGRGHQGLESQHTAQAKVLSICSFHQCS